MQIEKNKQSTLLGLTLQELTDLAESAYQPAYRGKQLFHALYSERVVDLEQISTLPQEFRADMDQQGFEIGLPAVEKKFISSDGTVRYLLGFSDGQSVEAVWMPEGDGGESGDGTEAGEQLNAPRNDAAQNDVSQKDVPRNNALRKWERATICLSSQVGCAVDCQFCLTALLGVKRNLTAGEIVGQVCAILNDQKVSPPNDRVNLVFMGMGEPLLNYPNFIKAVGLFVEGVGIPESRMTVSTAGIVPRIYDLSAEALRPKLAISLNASNDALRTQLMPINKKWNLEKLLLAAREFQLRPREKLTFEYVLLDEVNDGPTNAREVVEMLRGLRAKVNLIALNPGPGIAFRTPAQPRVLEFQRILMDGGIPAYIRRPRGRDIFAACGQLKRTAELTSIT